MNISKAERKQIENEMIFRRMNEKVGDDLVALDAMHIEDDNIQLLREDDFLLRFKCECSDENCEARIAMKMSDYDTVHIDRDTFIVKKDHQVDPIEKVIKEEEFFNVVIKNNSTAEPSNVLNVTEIDNSNPKPA